MSRKLFDIIATLENLSEDGQLGATEAAMDAAETATDVAEGNAEVIKDVNEIDSTDTAIEDAFEAESKIENLLDAAEDTMKDGGMSPKEAKLMEISHESIMSNLGMSHRANLSKNPVATLEHFNGDGRGGATLLTIESLKSTAATIGKNIIAALQTALRAVVNFLVGLVRNRSLMEKHLLNLQKFVSSIKGESKKKDRLTAGASALTVGGTASVATAKEILASADKLITASTKIADAISEKVGTSTAAAAIESAVQGIGPLTHGRKIKHERKEDVVTVSIEEGGKGAESIEAPSKADMSALLTQALGVIRRLKDYEKTQSKLKAAVEKIIDALKEGYNKVRAKTGGQDAAAGAARTNARQARSMMSKAGGSFPGAAFAAVKAVADYVTAGARNLGAEGTAPSAPSGTALAIAK